MTSVTEIDRLVVSDDAVAARLWPRLGPRVRRAYLDDRDGWVALRRKVEAGATLPPTTLAAQHKVFAGWARAFRAAAAGQAKHAPATKVVRRSPRPTARAPAAAPASASAPRGDAAATALPPASRVALSAPTLATAAQVKGSGETAVAGGLVLAGLIAVAARRKRA